MLLFAQGLAILATRQSISDELEKHPYEDSLLAMSDILNNWRVPNAANNLPAVDLVQLKTPFITPFAQSNFVVVSKFDLSSLMIRINRSKKMKIDVFIEKEIF